VGLQVALCSILLVEAGLFVRSLQRVESQDLGFSPEHLIFVTLDFRGHPDALERDRTYAESAARLEQLSGVTGATIAAAMPFGSFNVPPISVPGNDKPPSSNGQLPFMLRRNTTLSRFAWRQGNSGAASLRRGMGPVHRSWCS
jgi:hypothetical protein